ncbi:hypothetical protein CVO_08630 [Sulfurimonas sp. CVO]|nr:hypothetical protein CVO_08630 [Sulfurimonas sp. CVO]
MRGLEPPRLAAPDPKSIFERFSSFLKLFHFLSKSLYLGIYKRFKIFISYHLFSLFFKFCSKNCSKKNDFLLKDLP